MRVKRSRREYIGKSAHHRTPISISLHFLKYGYRAPKSEKRSHTQLDPMYLPPAAQDRASFVVRCPLCHAIAYVQPSQGAHETTGHNSELLMRYYVMPHESTRRRVFRLWQKLMRCYIPCTQCPLHYGRRLWQRVVLDRCCRTTSVDE